MVFAPLRGTLLIEGDAINSYLRTLKIHNIWHGKKSEPDNKAQYNQLMKTMLNS